MRKFIIAFVFKCVCLWVRVCVLWLFVCVSMFYSKEGFECVFETIEHFINHIAVELFFIDHKSWFMNATNYFEIEILVL